MTRKSIHVIKHDGQWAAKSEGSKRARILAPTQGEAIEAARRMARREHVELVIHGRDGRIRARDSYGHDPYPPRG